jgi:hypothetical protein
MSLDLAVAQAQFQLGVLRRALHEHTGWSIEARGTHYPATRVRHDDRVIFRTSLPSMDPGEVVTLYWGDEFQGAREVHPSDDEPQHLTWELSLAQPVGV